MRFILSVVAFLAYLRSTKAKDDLSDSETCKKDDGECLDSPNRAQFDTGMAWRSSGANNVDLVSQLVANRVVKSKKVQQVLSQTDRGEKQRRHLDGAWFQK